MQTVDACTKAEADAIHQILIKNFPPLYADVWKVGLNMSLRISDLLAIQYDDIDLQNGRYRTIEQKTGKNKIIKLNHVVIDIVNRRRADYPGDTWLFQVHSNRANNKPADRSHVGAMFKKAGDMLGLKVGTHSMRKSRGAALYADNVPIEMIAKVLNHSNPSTTMRYIGITQQQIEKTYEDYAL